MHNYSLTTVGLLPWAQTNKLNCLKTVNLIEFRNMKRLSPIMSPTLLRLRISLLSPHRIGFPRAQQVIAPALNLVKYLFYFSKSPFLPINICLNET